MPLVAVRRKTCVPVVVKSMEPSGSMVALGPEMACQVEKSAFVTMELS